MTPDEWQEISDWVEDKWERGWTAEQQVSWYNDPKVGLRGFDAVDVWAAVYHLYSEGSAFPPNGSQLFNRCVLERRQSAQADIYRSLPEERGERATDWIAKRFDEPMTGTEFIRRIHSEQRPCGTKTCDVHYPMVDA